MRAVLHTAGLLPPCALPVRHAVAEAEAANLVTTRHTNTKYTAEGQHYREVASARQTRRAWWCFYFLRLLWLSPPPPASSGQRLDASTSRASPRCVAATSRALQLLSLVFHLLDPCTGAAWKVPPLCPCYLLSPTVAPTAQHTHTHTHVGVTQAAHTACPPLLPQSLSRRRHTYRGSALQSLWDGPEPPLPCHVPHLRPTHFHQPPCPPAARARPTSPTSPRHSGSESCVD